MKQIEWPSKLLLWYDANRRELPWRENKDPYRIWVSEIMLQQTRVEAVKPYFEEWMRQFPTLSDVANASEETILKAWQGLGYYSRARNLQLGMQQVIHEFNGTIPKDRKSLSSLKGVGPYTAGAISSIAFNEREPAVDGNVLRIYARLYNIHEDILSTKGKNIITEKVIDTLPSDRPGDFNESLMDFGSAICIPKSPRCEICPLSSDCKACIENTAQDLPIRKKKKAPKEVDLDIVLLRHNHQYLLHKRPHGGVLRDMWEFPTWERTNEGILTFGDDAPTSLQKILKTSQKPYILREEMKNVVAESDGETVSELQCITHVFSHIKWTMHVRAIIDISEAVTPDILNNTGDVWRFVSPEHFTDLPWAGPHGKITTLCR